MATEVKVPDIGDFKDVPIIEVHVKEGDTIGPDDPIISLESDKATMEVPAPSGGVVEKLLIKIGDKVSEGHPILLLKGEGDAKGDATSAPRSESESKGNGAAPADTAALIAKQEPPESAAPPAPVPAPAASGAGIPDFSQIHASPAVRRLARELGVDLNAIKGTGEKGRITKEDVKGHLTRSAAPAPSGAVFAGGGMGIPEIPAVDFSKFGPTETKPLARIKKISGPHLHRAWLNVPLVTHQDEADITETEAYRKDLDKTAKDKGYRVTLLAFLIKASVSALRQHPEFNASLSPDKEALILKRYYNIGVAVDTPDGLVVPVVKDADRKGIGEISQELGALSKKARDGKLGSGDMQGASFTISSLGGIGGTAFTPLVNAPEVAILGVVRSRMAPVWDGSEFKPRLMLPLSVSYDHRVIDGALAARFTRHLAHVLEDVRRLVI
ncbi:catalytic domain of components of various dehydrogenase complexes [Methylobacterium sp. 4-46]|uniref:dihydrolipoyllysine-residue acetyltransferase n=1 Tax=unclassified Methylobacterium TaxID=2615210 RepID=UPI000152D4C6|nr:MULTISPECIES: dihydrolipoyllysine-residue acetyltransferase [Methylobacterium]ACA20566.1 catalytic domain of components of various dehydrogenase complexes [Methylobacterium sp. 4-46]WFT79731.1 dihydrolipoyllysine-residue acetyltransferase [Methylobacterium nodulans]